MSQTSRDAALQRIEAGLVRLGQAIGRLPARQADGAVARETHEALLAAHDMLRTRTEAAIQGMDRLLGREETS